MQKYSTSFKEGEPQKPSTKNFEKLALNASFCMVNSQLCRLLNFCSVNGIECDGKRIPWCNLEQKLNAKELPTLAFKQLKQHRVIKILFQINTALTLNIKPETNFFKGEKFTCPFFRIDMGKCEFLICPYNSGTVSNTNCILSIDKESSLSEISIAKNTSKKNLLKLLFKNADWETFYSLLEKGNKKISTCKKCGQFKSICYKDKLSCSRRQKVVDQITMSEVIPTEFFSFPIILILLTCKKFFGNFCYELYPKNIWHLYTYQLNQLTGD